MTLFSMRFRVRGCLPRSCSMVLRMVSIRIAILVGCVSLASPPHADIEPAIPNQSDWNDLAQATGSSDMACVNLSGDLRQAPQSQLDKGYDGTHYGPQSNALIADLIRKHVELGGVSGE